MEHRQRTEDALKVKDEPLDVAIINANFAFFAVNFKLKLTWGCG